MRGLWSIAVAVMVCLVPSSLPVVAQEGSASAHQLAACPPGSDPDGPGAVGQARPPFADPVPAAIAFDRSIGRIVAAVGGYDEASGLMVMYSDGRVIGYDATANEWAILHDEPWVSDAEDLPVGPLARLGHKLVYDPVNERLVVMGGQVRTGSDPMWVPADDVWAFDTRSREWTELLAPSAPYPTVEGWIPDVGLAAEAFEYAPVPSLDPSLVPDADGFVFEEVAPGVRRLVTDGAGHFPSATHIREARDMDELAVDEQGRVLVWSTTHGIDNSLAADSQLWILGVKGVLDPDEGPPRPRDEAGSWGEPVPAVAPDGSSWWLGQWQCGGGIIRSEGQMGQRFLADEDTVSLAITPDGRVWVAVGHDDGETGGIYVIDPDAPGGPVETLAAPATETMWPGACGSPLITVSEVNLVGEPFFERATDEADVRRCSGFIVEPATVADGHFLSESQCWDEGAVWWEDAAAFTSGEMSATPDRWVELQLGGWYRLDEAIVQADNNDAYLLSYRDPETGSWLPLWTVPPAYSFGMATRPVPGDTSARQVLPIIVTTDALRFEAEFGDGMYSVSEIQLFGEPVVDDAMPPDEASMSTETGPPSPEPTESAAATTSTTSATAVSPDHPPESVAGAQGLAWSKAFDVPAPFVVESIVAAHDRFYALANDQDAGHYSPSVMWTSDDGTDWVELDVAELFSDGASLHSIVASERGLLALGFRPAPEGYAAAAWFSADGVAWDASDLGYVVEPATQPYTTSLLSFSGAALGSSGAVVTATAFPGFDWTAAQQAAAAALPTDLAGIDPGRVGTTWESVQVTVGPFVVHRESLDSLGLGEVAEAQRLTNSPYAASPERSMTFRTDDLKDWTVTDGNPIGAEYVMAIVALGGEYVAAASGRSGSAEVYVSSDGQAWDSTGERMEGMGGLFVMGDRLLTDGWQGSQRVTLISDDAGRTWVEAGMPDLSGSWIAAAGPAGILATGTEGAVGWGAVPEPGVIERDGYTVTFDSSRQEFTVADPDGTLLVSSALQMDDPMWGWGYTAPDELVFDYDAETAAVQDPSTGETLVTVTFADLDRLGASMISYGGEALLFSPDAVHWTMTTLDEAFGPETVLATSVVGSDRVVAVVGSGYPNPFGDQSIWVGLPVAGAAAPTVEAREAPPEVVMGGQAPVWEQVLDLEDRGFTTMLATDSGLWAIEEDRSEPSALWHSPDGTVWRRLDTAALLGEGAVVGEMTEGGPGLVAVGSIPSGAAREAVAWTSSDGQEWTLSPLGYTLPEPGRPFEVSELMIRAVAAGPDGAVVAATPYTGIDFGLLEPSVAAALPIGLRDYASGNGVMIDPWQISVSVGPFKVFSGAVTDLDVDQDLFDAYRQAVSGGSEDVLLFATDDYVTWQRVDGWPGGDDPVTAMTATADGYLAATWAWGSSAGLFASADGLGWEEAELPVHPGMVRWFGTEGGRLLMAGELGGRSAVWASDDDGETWTAWAGSPDDAWDVRAGAFGLVATGEHPSEWWDRSQWTTTVIEHDGMILSIDEGPGGCTVTGPDGELLLSADCSGAGDASGGLALPPSITADHDRAVFTVVDPGSREPLMTVTYREMQDAFERAQEPAGLGPVMFVAYSADGRTWSEQLISELTGAPGWIGPVAVSDDFAVMVVSNLDGPASLWRATAR